MYSFLKKHRFYFIYLPLVLYWIFLFIATTLPGSSVPDVGIGDKVTHFIAYLILSILLSLTFTFQKKSSVISLRPYFFTILIITLYSIIDEIHQSFIPGRFCELADIAADLGGTVSGAIFVKLLLYKSSLQSGN